jgi:hypothetical protein
VRFFAWGQGDGVLEEHQGGRGGVAAVVAELGGDAGGSADIQQQQEQQQLQEVVQVTVCTAGCREVLVPLPVPYKLPPQAYDCDEDKPWMVDVLYPGLDVLGHTRDQPVHLYGRME